MAIDLVDYALRPGTNFMELKRQVTKADFFDGEISAIQADSVLSKIHEVLRLLALQGEFITEAEWNEKRHGYQRNVSLAELAKDRCEDVEVIGGYVCDRFTKPLLPDNARGARGKPLT